MVGHFDVPPLCEWFKEGKQIARTLAFTIQPPRRSGIELRYHQSPVSGGANLAGSSLFSIYFSTAFLLSVGVNKSEARIIDSATEDISEARTLNSSSSKGGAACNKLENFTSIMRDTINPVRARQRAFQHWVNRCGERSELAMKTTTIGSTYWYRWSVFIPLDWQNNTGWDILDQWATWQNKREGHFLCLDHFYTQ